VVSRSLRCGLYGHVREAAMRSSDKGGGIHDGYLVYPWLMPNW
jgi:hypothetical protein